MGQLIDGVWHNDDRARTKDGRFVRSESQFRDWVTADGASGFKAEAGRYHLYISLACPWAHRALIVRRLKGLDEAISLSVVDWLMESEGWAFTPNDGVIPDPIVGASRLHEIYTHAQADYSGRVTVPVLWDRERATIVNNESAEIIRMFNSAFGAVGAHEPELCPPELQDEIDSVNERVFRDINNGVYRCGFATSQEAYEEAFDQLFAALDWCEERLASRRYLCGERLTEADWRLYTTLVRFDPVYVTHFKCNLRRIADYPNLSNYLRELYQVPGVAETCDFEHIKNHYFQSHTSINPTRVVPKGPAWDLSEPHDRARL